MRLLFYRFLNQSIVCHFCIERIISWMQIVIQDARVSWPQPYSQDFKCAIKYNNCTSITPPEQHLLLNQCDRAPNVCTNKTLFYRCLSVEFIMCVSFELDSPQNCDNVFLSKVFAIFSRTRQDKWIMIGIHKTVIFEYICYSFHDNLYKYESILISNYV